VTVIAEILVRTAENLGQMTAQQAKRQKAAEQTMPVALAELALPGR